MQGGHAFRLCINSQLFARYVKQQQVGEGCSYLLHRVHEASVLRAEAHKVYRQGEVIHVICDPGVRRQGIPLQPVVQHHHAALQNPQQAPSPSCSPLTRQELWLWVSARMQGSRMSCRLHASCLCSSRQSCVCAAAVADLGLCVSTPIVALYIVLMT